MVQRLFNEMSGDELPPIMEDVGLGVPAQPELRPQGLDQAAPLGFAGPAARTQSDRDFLDSLPTGAKIGLALQSFAAGYEGRPNPIDTLLTNRRAQEKSAREDLITTINTLEKGMNILRKLPPGSIQRKAVATELGKAVGPQFAPLFEAAGSEYEDAVNGMISIVKDSDVQQMILKACRNAPDQQACWMGAIKDDSLSKTMYKTVDTKRLPDIQKKMRIVSERLKKVGKDGFTLADLAELNTGEAIFTKDEMGTIERQEAWFGDLGLKTTEAIREGQKSAARVAERPDRLPTLGAIQEIKNKDGTTTQQRFKGTDKDGNLIWEVVGGAPAKGNELTAAAREKLKSEKAAYDRAVELLENNKIGPSGQSSDPKIQEKLTRKIPGPGGFPVDNKAFDHIFAGRVTAWLKATEKGDPYEREGRPEGAPVAPKAEAPKAKVGKQGGVDLNKAQQIKADYQAGKITRGEATRRLRALGLPG